MSNVQMESDEWAGLGMGCKGLSPGEWDGTWPANPEAGQEGRPHPFEFSAMTLRLVDLPLIGFEPRRDAALNEIVHSLVNRYIYSSS